MVGEGNVMISYKYLITAIICKEIQPVHPKGNQSWIFIGRTDGEAETPVFGELTHLKRPWCWERLKTGGEGDDSGSATQWSRVWVNSGSWWWTGRPGVLRFNGGRKESDTTERLNWTELNWTEKQMLLKDTERTLMLKIRSVLWAMLRNPWVDT